MQAAHGRPGKWRASSVLPQQTLMHKFAGVGVHQPTANQRLHKAASHIPVGSLLQQKLHVDAHCFHALFTEFTPTTGRTWVHNHEQLTKAVHSAVRCSFRSFRSFCDDRHTCVHTWLHCPPRGVAGCIVSQVHCAARCGHQRVPHLHVRAFLAHHRPCIAAEQRRQLGRQALPLRAGRARRRGRRRARARHAAEAAPHHARRPRHHHVTAHHRRPPHHAPGTWHELLRGLKVVCRALRARGCRGGHAVVGL